MKKLVRPATLPLVRTGLLSAGGVVVVGLLGAALVVHVRSIRQRQLRKPLATKAQHQGPASNEGRASRGVVARAKEGASEGIPELTDGDYVLLLDEDLPVTPKELWKLIYDPNFVQSFHDKMSNRDCKIGKWGHTEGQLARQVSYIKPLKKNAFGPKEAFTEERYTCTRRGEAGFVVEVKAYTRKVPYGTNFYVRVMWTASRLAEGGTKLRVCGGVVFAKRLLAGGIIKKASNEGLKETYAAYREHLLGGLSPGPRKGPKAAPEKPAPGHRVQPLAAHAEAQLSPELSSGILARLGHALLVLGLLSVLSLAMLGARRFSKPLAYDLWLEGLRVL